MNYYDIFIETELPKPLSNEKICECIKLAQEGDLEARDKVIVHNIRIVLNQVLKNFTDFPNDSKDFVSIGIIGLIKAVDTFDIERGMTFLRMLGNVFVMKF